jgi:glycerate 2-kinase
MRVLLALDKFKGSLTSAQAADSAALGLQRGGWEGDISICPIADGGEGFTETVLNAIGGTWCEAPVHDAQGREVIARYGLIHRLGHAEAVMEMSAASGLAMVSDLPLDPLRASTRGTGELMLHALENGVERILIGIGGSATNDGGSGMASALGYQFLDENENIIADIPAGLEMVHRIAKSRVLPAEVVVASDVNNPLLGERGATRVYGPQKGVRDVDFFESRLETLANLVTRDLGCDHRDQGGAGAAGGLGFGLLSFCGARLQCGFSLVAELTGLAEKIAQSDLVITGEGCLDGQTLHGKGPAGVADLARSLGKPVIGIGGIVQDSPKLQQLFAGLIQVKPEGMPISEAISQAGALLEECIAQRVNWIKSIVQSPS